MRTARSLALASCALVAACAMPHRTDTALTGTPRPATDAPAHFTPPAGLSAGETCVSPLTDPRTGVQLRFARAKPGVGDYEIPGGRYGARGDELLRIDCATLAPIGLVRR